MKFVQGVVAIMLGAAAAFAIAALVSSDAVMLANVQGFYSLGETVVRGLVVIALCVFVVVIMLIAAWSRNGATPIAKTPVTFSVEDRDRLSHHTTVNNLHLHFHGDVDQREVVSNARNLIERQ